MHTKWITLQGEGYEVRVLVPCTPDEPLYVLETRAKAMLIDKLNKSNDTVDNDNIDILLDSPGWK